MDFITIDIDKKWESLKINQRSVIDLLNWSWFKFSNRTWPPHEFPWFSRDEREILLWISTEFKTAKELEEWLSINVSASLKKEHKEFIEWLKPDELFNSVAVNQSEGSNLLLINFLLNCIQRSLLWWDPCPTWPSHLKGAVMLAFGLLKSRQENGSIDKNDSIKALTYLDDIGWVQWKSEPFIKIVQTVYEMLVLVSNMNKLTSSEVMEFSKKVKETLLASIESLWLYENDYSDWEYTDESQNKTELLNSLNQKRQSLQNFNNLINKEKHWFEYNFNKISNWESE